MRAKRSKQYRKLMSRYQQTFNFREPYQCLLDAQIIKDASKFKMKLGNLLESTLSGSIKPMITQCCIRHLYNAETTTEAEKRQKDGWIEVAKAAERRRCGHHELESPLSALECLESVVDPKHSGTNKNRYVVASQDPEVRPRMREIAGVPLIYINRSVMILEPMAARTEQVREREEREKIRAGLKGRRGGVTTGTKRKRDEDEDTGDMTQAHDDDEVEAPHKKRKVKGPKGPNPLSVKKANKEKQRPELALGKNTRIMLKETNQKNYQSGGQDPVGGVLGDAYEPSGTELSRKRKRKRKLESHQDTAPVTGGAAEHG